MNVGEIDYEAVISAKLYQSTYRLFFYFDQQHNFDFFKIKKSSF